MGVVSRKQLEQECGARKVCRKGSIDIVHQRLVQNYLETATGREMCGMVLDQNALQACMELFNVVQSCFVPESQNMLDRPNSRS